MYSRPSLESDSRHASSTRPWSAFHSCGPPRASPHVTCMTPTKTRIAATRSAAVRRRAPRLGGDVQVVARQVRGGQHLLDGGAHLRLDAVLRRGVNVAHARLHDGHAHRLRDHLLLRHPRAWRRVGRGRVRRAGALAARRARAPRIQRAIASVVAFLRVRCRRALRAPPARRRRGRGAVVLHARTQAQPRDGGVGLGAPQRRAQRCERRRLQVAPRLRHGGRGAACGGQRSRAVSTSGSSSTRVSRRTRRRRSQRVSGGSPDARPSLGLSSSFCLPAPTAPKGACGRPGTAALRVAHRIVRRSAVACAACGKPLWARVSRRAHTRTRTHGVRRRW